MTGVDPREVEAVLSQIHEGMVFERFGLAFLSAIRGEEFQPVGGTRDRGIDGLENCFEVEVASGVRAIYQLSIERDVRRKIGATLRRLREAGVRYQRLVYVSNQVVGDADTLGDEFFLQFRKAVLFVICDGSRIT